MYTDLTKGNIAKSLILFSLPMMAGNMLQQFYNIADTLIVGRVLGANALAAVGSAYTIMTFITSIFLGMSMGASALFSIYQGKGDTKHLRISIVHSFGLIMVVTILLNLLVCFQLNPILTFLHVPNDVWKGIHEYLSVIFLGIIATSLYNFFSCLLKSLGNSTVPLIFLGVSAIVNIGLDLLFVAVWPFGIAGAAWATIISQYLSGIGIFIFILLRCPELFPKKEELVFNKGILHEIFNLSFLTCLQQSVMNFGILLVQGLVNSFGSVIMAAFAAGVKIDTFAYLPVQDFGNAYSFFVAQNYGANKQDRIKEGTKTAFKISILFSVLISILVCVFASQLIGIFVSNAEVIQVGKQYLWMEGSFYFGIGCLFLFYGYFRAIKRAQISLVLTIISLGLRVVLAYILSSYIGVIGIWLSIPIGWMLADLAGLVGMKTQRQ